LVRLTLFLFLVVLGSCSQFSKSPTSKAWHNINAKYNSLIIARNNTKELLELSDSLRYDNFSFILPILDKIDSNQNTPLRPNLEEVIKKSSLIAERHSNSKYIDEAYFLLGKARLIKGESINAIETFKYINTNSKNQEYKQKSLIWLLRSYIEIGDYVTADQVLNIIKSQKLFKNNQIDYFLTRAYYHQLSNDLAVSVILLEEALKKIPKSSKKARLYYIAGQIYEKLDKIELARKNYIKANKNNPSYEIEFYSNIGLLMTQSKALATLNEFEKMLEDRKNIDLKDKIYLKMGDLEISKRKYDSGISYYQKAIASTKVDIQKSNSYRLIAETYYNNLQDYEKASIYYDSTLIYLSEKSKDFKAINQKSSSLVKFIQYNKSLALEDSLQRLAAMNPLALDKKIKEILISQDLEAKKQIELAEKIISSNSPPTPSLKTATSKNKWLFYNTAELDKSNVEFVKIWGKRPLEDNWRRQDKASSGLFSNNQEPRLQKTETKIIKADTLDIFETPEYLVRKQDIINKIPKSKEQLEASNRKIEEAYFQLGKIYKLQFNEDENAIKTFKNLLVKFPNTSYEPETLYFLAILAEQTEQVKYKNRLFEKYPNSSFSRQLRIGKVKGNEADAIQDYQQIYKIYEEKNYTEVLQLTQNGLEKHIGTSVEDKMALIRIYSLAKLGKKIEYLIALEDFLNSYPSSNLVVNVKEMLSIAKK
jgi:tetratricopeptide (TPR) repeat protein